MDGLANYAGWRWIFIMEGILTIALGAMGYVFIVDFPDQTKGTKKFLSTEEIEIMISRVEADRGDSQIIEFSIWPYLQNAMDWKAWVLATNFGLVSTVVFSVAYFLPIVLRSGLGFSVLEAQTLNAPASVPRLALTVVPALLTMASSVMCLGGSLASPRGGCPISTSFEVPSSCLIVSSRSLV